MSTESHIRNPFELMLERFSTAASDAGDAAVRQQARAAQAAPVIRRIGYGDLWAALRGGVEDLGAARADVLFIGVIYPLAGLLVAKLAFNDNLLPLVFPLIAGFALIGPIAAIGLYEISRRREQGLRATWVDAFGVLHSPALGSILWLGFMLLGLFVLWLAAAYGVYMATLGPALPTGLASFAHDALLTGRGWGMIVAGVTVGAVFAAVALAVSVVSFPLLLDRDVGMPMAVKTSLHAVAANMGPLGLWGLIVAVALAVGSIPALLGMIFVMPVLGHATWRLYRKLIG